MIFVQNLGPQETGKLFLWAQSVVPWGQDAIILLLCKSLWIRLVQWSWWDSDSWELHLRWPLDSRILGVVLEFTIAALRYRNIIHVHELSKVKFFGELIILVLLVYSIVIHFTILFGARISRRKSLKEGLLIEGDIVSAGIHFLIALSLN